MTEITSAIIAAVVSIIVAWWTASRSTKAAQERMRREFALEFASEAAVKTLLEHPEWECRTFETIKKRIGGFDDDELRKLLVRAGAVRAYKDNDPKQELWGLASRNPRLLKNEDA